MYDTSTENCIVLLSDLRFWWKYSEIACRRDLSDRKWLANQHSLTKHATLWTASFIKQFGIISFLWTLAFPKRADWSYNWWVKATCAPTHSRTGICTTHTRAQRERGGKRQRQTDRDRETDRDRHRERERWRGIDYKEITGTAIVMRQTGSLPL